MGGSVGHRPGGIAGLHRLITENGGAVRYDLRRAGVGLDEVGNSVSWSDVAAIIRHTPAHESAVARALDPDAWITPTHQLLQALEQATRVLAWMKTKDAERRTPQNYPEPIPLTAAQIEAARPESDHYGSMTLNQAQAWLNWDNDGRRT